jgi:hypothetical protein
MTQDTLVKESPTSGSQTLAPGTRMRRVLLIVAALTLVAAVAGGLRWVWRAEIAACLEPQQVTWEVVAVCESACGRGDAKRERGGAGAKQDAKEAARLYRFACDHGEARGCDALAAMKDH